MHAMNKASDLEFIKLVESYPILYAKEHTRGQKNSTLKNDVWREVAEILKKSEVACITRWKSIRDRFGKEFRRQQENPQDVTNWELFPHLMFLKDHYKHGCARNNDTIDNIKYEPKPKRRKANRSDEYDEESAENPEKISPEELALTQDIISLVKDHDVLYDRKRVRDSKNLTAKREAWTNISNSLGISEEICYAKWKKVRDRFSREYRNHQLYPERPITWVYFNDLRFLESHYRKGIPLPVEEIRQREKAAAEAAAAASQQHHQQHAENPWGDDYTRHYYSDNDEHHEHDLITEEGEEFQEIQEQTFDEFLFLPNKKVCVATTPKSNMHPHQTIQHVTYHEAQDVSHTTYESAANITLPSTSTMLTSKTESGVPLDPEEKLNNVINNMECVLRQSHDCLRALQQQKVVHENEILQTQSNSFNIQPDMLQKVNILLDGLQPDQRQKAERKILQFLCECQIKTLNNEEISDVSHINIY